MRAGLALSLLLAGPAAAQDAMSAAEFEAWSEGRTLTYSTGGSPYGAEEHRAGRRVRWTRFDETCVEGVWFPRGEEICFVYDEGVEGERCWRYTRTPDGLRGELRRADGTFVADPIRRVDEPLDCVGPEVGS